MTQHKYARLCYTIYYGEDIVHIRSKPNIHTWQIACYINKFIIVSLFIERITTSCYGTDIINILRNNTPINKS